MVNGKKKIRDSHKELSVGIPSNLNQYNFLVSLSNKKVLLFGNYSRCAVHLLDVKCHSIKASKAIGLVEGVLSQSVCG